MRAHGVDLAAAKRQQKEAQKRAMREREEPRNAPQTSSRSAR